MNKIYDLFDSFFKELPEINSRFEPVSIKNGLNSKSALLLVIINNYPTLDIDVYQNLIKLLCDKGLCEYNEKKLSVTTRGAILAKSLTTTLKNI